MEKVPKTRNRARKGGQKTSAVKQTRPRDTQKKCSKHRGGRGTRAEQKKSGKKRKIGQNKKKKRKRDTKRPTRG